jgi:2-C-methyl-D-erythritol 4-phosphate cytidylyltransferase
MADPVVAVVVAAGAGVRLGGSTPKALRFLADKPLVLHALEALAAGGVSRAVVVIAPGAEAQFETALANAPIPAGYVSGGSRRQDSVQQGLAAILGDPEASSARFVLVHDAARPLVPAAVVARVIEALRDGAEAVVPVVPVVDSIREVEASGASRAVDRSVLRAVQTPQGFRVDVLTRALASAAAEGRDVSDDATAVEATGVPVVLVDGSPEAVKITGPGDLPVAESILRGRQ